MSFAVTHPGGVGDKLFLEYSRVLRKHKADLGRAPRVPDPSQPGRWLYAWPTRVEARAFAAELKKETFDKSWKVIEVEAPPSEGPLGPAVIQLLCRGDGLTFGVETLTRVVIESAFPGTINAASYVLTRPETWEEYRKAKGGLAPLVREIAPSLTGLSLEELDSLGYVVIDSKTEETLVSVPPAATEQRLRGSAAPDGQGPQRGE
jgi:hypothetical protein